MTDAIVTTGPLRGLRLPATTTQVWAIEEDEGDRIARVWKVTPTIEARTPGSNEAVTLLMASEVLEP